jgi:hypothetical protein
MLGSRNVISATKMRPSALGLQLYEVTVPVADLPALLERACGFIESCFPAGSSIPTGLVPWQACKWMKASDEMALDPISMDALAAWRSQR